MMWKTWLVLLFMMLNVNTVYAEEVEEQEKHVLIVVVPGFSMEEAQHLVDKGYELFEQAAMGAMNVRPNGPYSYLNNMVTLSIGEKAVGIEGWNGYEDDDPFRGMNIRAWMEQVSGVSSQSQIYHPYLKELKEKNMNASLKVGEVGRLLREADIDTTVYGHSDLGEEKVRYGSLLIMDENGNAQGELAKAVKSEPTASYGIEMNETYLIDKLSTDKKKNRLTVIEWGDLHRLFKQRPFMEEALFEAKRLERLDRLHSFLERALKDTTVDDIWFLSPMMHTASYNEKQLLAPVYHWGNGAGFLTSNTTRQPYLVSSIDFMPTILHSFEIEGSTRFLGNMMVQKDDTEGIEHFYNKIEEMVFIYKSRASVLSMYITCLVLALSGAAILNFFKGKDQKNWQWLTRLLLLSALSSPLLFLILAKSVMQLGVFFFVVVLLLASITCGYIAGKSKAPTFLIGTVTFILITIDLFLHSSFMQRSYLGYDPIIGARYYGLGNEFAGIYLVAALMMLRPFLDCRKWLALTSCSLIFLFLVMMLGKNTLGTNAGATLAACIAFSFLLYKVSEVKWSWKKVSLLASFCFIGGVLLLYFLQGKGDKTHIGTAFGHVRSGDFQYIFQIIARKIEMNVKIFKYSNWTQLLVTSYVLGAIILWRKQFRLKGKDQKLFLQTGVVASFALLLLNDSGVVAAATSMFCVISTYYYWLSLKDREA